MVNLTHQGECTQMNPLIIKPKVNFEFKEIWIRLKHVSFSSFIPVALVMCCSVLYGLCNGWLQKLQVLGQINPLPNQLHLSNLKVPGMEPAGNVKWYLWSGIMTFGLENTNVGS